MRQQQQHRVWDRVALKLLFTGQGANVNVIVFWSGLSIGALASQGATITLVAEGDNNGFGQGSQSLTLWRKAPAIFTISPILAALTPNPTSASQPFLAAFQVRNVGTTTETIFPTCITSASVFCASHSLNGATFAPFVSVQF